ncbi:putative F-box protein At1g32420 [Silene latifolia]|uniref:putative F-box protein At1g32420 n=1 Tax=Silene latifolia TaxID=37657 RepID=UPI003D76F144
MENIHPHTSKKEQVIGQRSYLSDDLIFQEILTRLPVKSILRFKSISKQWYSTLSSSNFVNAHLIKSPFSHPSAPVNTLFIMDLMNFYVFSYDDDQLSGNLEDNLVKLDPRFSVENDDGLQLTGSCNGLVCLTSLTRNYFILWNPATREFHKYASDEYLKRFNKATTYFTTSGFGYVSSVDDYKFIGILTIRQGNVQTTIGCIFSLRENRWRNIDLGHNPYFLFGQGVLVSEKLYWRAYSNQAGGLLIIFDLAVERFDMIKVERNMSDFLGVMGGCLGECKYNKGDKLIHILEPPAVVKSIGIPNGLTLEVFSQIIGFTKTDKYFVTLPFNYKGTIIFPSRILGTVDTRARPMQYRIILEFNEYIEIARYVPSLVMPFRIEEPSEDRCNNYFPAP